ncbi:MAG: DUF5818 domain-containing protein [Geitlerinemataceae cyanobacterium]
MKVEGSIGRIEMGTGTWALNGKDGTTYELKDAPTELQKEGLKVRIEGTIRDDVMTLAAIGPVLEVTDFQVL